MEKRYTKRLQPASTNKRVIQDLYRKCPTCDIVYNHGRTTQRHMKIHAKPCVKNAQRVNKIQENQQSMNAHEDSPKKIKLAMPHL